ncbi:MAG TPA: Ku protein [Steroidobacteraceae bacterium]|nr:Ku protein [Steroidobacteraceae bacterium]
MAARSMASLTISFGMVAIPVDLYTATLTSERISFNLLHAKDGSRLKQQYVCIKEGTVVDRNEIVKGYEFAKDQYVQFTADEIKALDEAGSDSIDIVEFVPLASVDPLYFDRSYYLAPGKGGARPYALLAAALRETQRCAVGHWASHGRDHMIVLRPLDQAMVMHQLHFAAEVRSIHDIGAVPTEVKEGELKLARQLIEQQATDRFDPTLYVDEVRARIEAAIQKKVEGQQVSVSVAPTRTPSGNVIDLMAALRASLGTGEKEKLGARKGPKRVQRKAPTRRTSRA